MVLPKEAKCCSIVNVAKNRLRQKSPSQSAVRMVTGSSDAGAPPHEHGLRRAIMMTMLDCGLRALRDWLSRLFLPLCERSDKPTSQAESDGGVANFTFQFKEDPGPMSYTPCIAMCSSVQSYCPQPNKAICQNTNRSRDFTLQFLSIAVTRGTDVSQTVAGKFGKLQAVTDVCHQGECGSPEDCNTVYLAWERGREHAIRLLRQLRDHQ